MTLKYVKILSLRTGNMDENQFFADYVVMFEPGQFEFLVQKLISHTYSTSPIPFYKANHTLTHLSLYCNINERF